MTFRAVGLGKMVAQRAFAANKPWRAGFSRHINEQQALASLPAAKKRAALKRRAD
jgi:hypothetical protein